jgi:hypothetical protein
VTVLILPRLLLKVDNGFKSELSPYSYFADWMKLCF